MLITVVLFIKTVIVSDHHKIKKMCKHAVKKLPYLVRYVPDRYKTQQMSINITNV